MPDRDVLKDLLPLRYDPGRVTPERIIEEVRRQGFQATVASGPKASAPDKPPDGGDQ